MPCLLHNPVIFPVRLAKNIHCSWHRLFLLSSGFLAFTVAGRDTLSRQYLQEMLNNDVMWNGHNCVYLAIPQHMWWCCSRLSEGFRTSRGPLLTLDIYRNSIGDSALFWYEWRRLNGRGYECMNTNTHGNLRTELLFYWTQLISIASKGLVETKKT